MEIFLCIIAIIVIMLLVNALSSARIREHNYKKLLGRHNITYIPSSKELFEAYEERRRFVSLLTLLILYSNKRMQTFLEKEKEILQLSRRKVVNE